MQPIAAVASWQVGIGALSPLLDTRGNSVRGVKVCADLSRQFGLHVFDLGANGAQLQQAICERLAV